MIWLAAAFALATPPVPERDADTSLEGQLDDGAVVDLAFASRSSVACFPATQFTDFDGHQVFHVVEQDVGMDLVLRLTPSGEHDLNLYALQLGSLDRGQRPPKVNSAWRCSAKHSAKEGEAETVRLYGHTTAKEVVVAIAGADGLTTGKYTLEVWQESAKR